MGVQTGYTSGQNLANVNNGTIFVESGFDAIGLEFAGIEGSFTNNGALIVHGQDYAVGVQAGQYIHGEFINNGTITVSVDPASPYASIGVLLDEQSIIATYSHINTGTINADIAFYVREDHGPSPSNIVDVLENSGFINGAIFLNNGNDALINTGTISGRSILGRGNDTYDGRGGHHTGTVEGGNGNDVLIGGTGAEAFTAMRIPTRSPAAAATISSRAAVAATRWTAVTASTPCPISNP